MKGLRAIRTKRIYRVIAYAGSIFLILIFLCYCLIRMFDFMGLQTLWVTTSMSTMSRQGWAKFFASEERIGEILDSNPLPSTEDVQDVGMLETRLNESLSKRSTSNVEVVKIDTTGFEFLELGIYVRDVEDKLFNGKLVLVTDSTRLRVGMTKTPGERGDQVKYMVPNGGGVLGVNGGWFIDPNYEGSGGTPTGFIIQNGEVTFVESEGLTTVVGYDSQGRLLMGEFDLEGALDAGFMECMSTLPIVILNGEGLIVEGDGGWGIAPRTAIGQRADGSTLLLVIDGRQLESIGATLLQVQEIMLEAGAVNAICLDGGSSTTMYYDGAYLNKPSLGYERYIPTCWIVV